MDTQTDRYGRSKSTSEHTGEQEVREWLSSSDFRAYVTVVTDEESHDVLTELALKADMPSFLSGTTLCEFCGLSLSLPCLLRASGIPHNPSAGSGLSLRQLMLTVRPIAHTTNWNGRSVQHCVSGVHQLSLVWWPMTYIGLQENLVGRGIFLPPQPLEFDMRRPHCLKYWYKEKGHLWPGVVSHSYKKP